MWGGAYLRKVYILHENPEWTIHLTRRLDELSAPYETWDLAQGHLDLSSVPPEGVFYSRMSASSHTRDHRYAVEYTSSVLAWLESHGRRVINGSQALQIEVSKAHQAMALWRAGIPSPRTSIAVGEEQLMAAAQAFAGIPFIVKHNRAGKGLGVQLFRDTASLASMLAKGEYDAPVDGVWIVQEYIESPDATITRCEFVGGKFLYAVRVDTSEGFELCPADACQIGDMFCPVGEGGTRPKFEIVEGHPHEWIESYERMLAENGILVAGIESIRDRSGRVYTYDINTNTNYNSDAEARAGIFGMLEVATFLKSELDNLEGMATPHEEVPMR